ncbi:MAG TPA: hypothetical protein VL101_10835 [Nordella sp.]|nr:hypothetical protein [Nordella sp.]
MSDLDWRLVPDVRNAPALFQRYNQICSDARRREGSALAVENPLTSLNNDTERTQQSSR